MINFLEETLKGDQINIKSGQTARLLWSRPAAGVIHFEPKKATNTSIVISVGVHGNETAPIEIVSHLVNKLLQDQYPLKIRLLVIIGNLEAMRQGKRYLNIDMNRLFSGNHQDHPTCYETQRAQALEKLMKNFYNAAPKHHKQHFDLHTAIRASHHTRFGLLPYKQDGCYHTDMLAWLNYIGLEALVVNHAPTATFSYFSSEQCSAVSCTLELGKAHPFNDNNLQAFIDIERGLINLIAAQPCPAPPKSKLQVYQVTDVLTKSSDRYELHVDDKVKNFTPFKKGFSFASDNGINHPSQDQISYILFPNKQVKVGFRTGLVLKKISLSQLTSESLH